MKASPPKINWISILQGWAMLWVVIGHAPLGEPGNGPEWENALYSFAYSFHMPLFMLISGYLFNLTRLSSWNYTATIKDKSVRLLIPMLVFTLLAFAAKLAVPSEMNRPTSFSIKEIINAFLYPGQSPLSEMWFIATLFWLFLLMPLWRRCVNRQWAMWAMLAILLAVHFYHPDIQLLCIGSVCEYAVYFYGGVLLSRMSAIKKIKGKGEWWLLAAGILCYVTGSFWTLHFVKVISGIGLSIALSLILDRYYPKALSSFRGYTYQIFLMGIFAQILVRIIYRHAGLYYPMTFVISILAGLYIPVLISKLAQSIAWSPLLVCFGIKPAKQIQNAH